MHPYQGPEGAPPRPGNSEQAAALVTGGEVGTSRRNRWKLAAAVLLLVGVAISWMQLDRAGVQQAAAGGKAASDGDRQSARPPSQVWAAAFVDHASDLTDEEYRLAAIAWDEQKRAERAAAKRKSEQSSALDPRRRWKRRVERLQQIVASYEDFPEGSIQWHARQSLQETLADAPRQSLAGPAASVAR